MKRLVVGILSFVLLPMIAGAVLANSGDDAAMLNQISNYRQWPRVNSEPVKQNVAVTPTVTGIIVNPDVAV